MRRPPSLGLLTASLTAALLLSTACAATQGHASDPAAAAATGTATTATPVAGTAVRRTASPNPLVGRSWGVYQGPQEQTWAPYEQATGRKKELLAKIALAPKAKWFGDWIPDDEIAERVRLYIDNATAADPEALVQMSIFRMNPWESEACRRLPTKAEKASYKRWIDAFVGQVGETHTAIILQPDGPFALCAPRGSKAPSRLIRYSAKKLAALPNTSVYIDAGAADWPNKGRQGGAKAAVRILVPAGVKFVRGVALNSTHYSATNREVARGATIVKLLAKRGITDKHVVVNTSSNGNPFEFGHYTGKDDNNAFVCKSKTDNRTCVTLGIPPTAAVDDPRWGLSERTNALARQYVDGYLWFGRPWLYRQADPFVMSRAIKLARSTPY